MKTLVAGRFALVFLLAIPPLFQGCISGDAALRKTTSNDNSGAGESSIILEKEGSYERVVLSDGYSSIWILEIDGRSRFRSQLRVLGDTENCLFVFYQYWNSIDRAEPPSFKITDQGVALEVLRDDEINTFEFPLLRNTAVFAWQEEDEGNLWPVPLGEGEAKLFFNSIRPPREYVGSH